MGTTFTTACSDASYPSIRLPQSCQPRSRKTISDVCGDLCSRQVGRGSREEVHRVEVLQQQLQVPRTHAGKRRLCERHGAQRLQPSQAGGLAAPVRTAEQRPVWR